MLLCGRWTAVGMTHLWIELQIIQSSCHVCACKHESAIAGFVHASALGCALMTLPFLKSNVKGVWPLLQCWWRLVSAARHVGAAEPCGTPGGSAWSTAEAKLQNETGVWNEACTMTLCTTHSRCNDQASYKTWRLLKRLRL